MCRVGENYIFIHIFKCGGTSIHNTLKDLDKSSKMLIGGHLDAECIRKYYEDNGKIDEFNNKFKFSIVRNPYDWLGSTYYYIKRSTGHEFNTKFSNANINTFVDWFIDEAMSFKTEEHQNKYLLQKQFITENRDVNGKIIVDYYTKLEDISQNWQYILNQIGLKYKKLPIKNKNTKTNGKYKDQFNAKSIKRIKETFAEDFNFFNYPQ